MDDSVIPSWTRRLGSNEDYVNSLLKRLADLKEQSDPAGGDTTKAGKDGRAFDALVTAGKLVEAVAGWAIDHAIGATLDHELPVYRQPQGTKDHPAYLEIRESVDDHRHEGNGSQISFRGAICQLRTSPASPNRTTQKQLGRVAIRLTSGVH